MARYRTSISLRLAVGFALSAGVLGIALLLTLNHLGRVRTASQRVSAYLEIRREATHVRSLAEQLLVLQPDLITPSGPEWERWGELRETADQIRQVMNPLDARFGEESEAVRDLTEAAALLQALLMQYSPYSDAPPPPDETVSNEVRAQVDHIIDLSDRLAASFDVRVVDASEQAQSAWAISIATAKIVFPVALLVSLLVVHYTQQSIVHPVRTLVDGTKCLASGDLGTRIELNGPEEFSELADSFNRMAEVLEQNQRELVEAEKLATVGRLAAGVAHEINNPITVIIGYTKMLQASLGDNPEARQQLRDIAEEAQQCRHIVQSLLDLSRPSEPAPGEVINPSEVVAEVISMLQALQLTEGVRIQESVIDRPLPLAIGRSRLRQLTLNIARNALEVLQEVENPCLRMDGYLRPREKLPAAGLKEGVAESSSFLVLAFADNGPGINPDTRERLFEPFFTTKADGMGLGLAICYNIARAHGGFIDLSSEGQGGTTVTVGLPLTNSD
ncbi:MAG: histidine kinase dimerization/phospho-acceptor domain-containing protein [Candidatus Brocadiia bacterium]